VRGNWFTKPSQIKALLPINTRPQPMRLRSCVVVNFAIIWRVHQSGLSQMRLEWVCLLGSRTSSMPIPAGNDREEGFGGYPHTLRAVGNPCGSDWCRWHKHLRTIPSKSPPPTSAGSLTAAVTSRSRSS